MNEVPYPNTAEENGSNPLKCRFESYWDQCYLYLLGLYLGDGHIVKDRRCHKLRIFLGKSQAEVIDRCMTSMQQIFHKNRIGCGKWDKEVVEVYCYNKFVPAYFPQHGRGLKKNRKIFLSQEQMELAKKYPSCLLLGLLDSDGSKYINTIKYKGKVYEYESYNFRNFSDGIIDIFTWLCDVLSIKYTCNHDRSSVDIRKRNMVALINNLYRNLNI